ncbi:hypothetical protein BT69DRAFT_1321257 [Atractiella rhizophila]|nr:hypothetical protein BT69DRAFT_1321257 [Atractiella rhizophila]
MANEEWFLFYGPQLANPILQKLNPSKRHSVHVKDAYLSFSYPGIPFLEPCYPTAIVRGINDTDFKGKDKKGDEESYKKWLWERCSPGVGELFGNGVPELEGVAMLLPQGVVEQIKNSQVQCTPFEDGDKSKSAGPTFTATALILPFTSRFKDRGIAPSSKTLMRVIRPAITSGLSLDFMSHLVLIRPAPPPTTSKMLFITFLLIPHFLFLFLPLHLAQLLLSLLVSGLRRFDGFEVGEARKVLSGTIAALQVGKKEVAQWSWVWAGWWERWMPDFSSKADRKKEAVKVGSGL